MKARLHLLSAVLALLAPLASFPAAAAEDSDRYGSLATGMPYDRQVRIGPNTKRIGVWRLETVSFVAPDGREFRWRFDSLRQFETFPLARIAPAGFPAPEGALVDVNGEIPVSDR